MKKPMVRKPATIYYRRLADAPWHGADSLQQQVQGAMNETVEGHLLRDRFKKRIYKAEENNLFINLFIDEKTHARGAIFGDLTMYSSGKMQAIIDAETDATFANVEHIVPPEKKEFMSSIMYWMIYGNHVFILQSKAIQSDTLEDYFTWMLRERTSRMPTDQSIVLLNKFDPKNLPTGIGKTKSLIIGGAIRPKPAPATTTMPKPGQTEVHEAVSHGGITGWEQAKEILATIVGGTANVEKIMHAVPKDAELSVEVHIGFKTKRKKAHETPLSVLETGLRNMPDSYIAVEGDSGKKGVDGTLRLHHKAQINLYAKSDPSGRWLAGMFEHQDVLRAMLEAYDRFVLEGKISE